MVDLMLVQQCIDEESWYCGMVDVVYQNFDIIQSIGVEYIVVLVGDYVYKMDYFFMFVDYVVIGVGCMVGCIEVFKVEVSVFGVMVVDGECCIIVFKEKFVDLFCILGCEGICLVSMGIYVFNVDYFYCLLEEDLVDFDFSYDFGKDVIFKVVVEQCVVVYFFGMSCISNFNGVLFYWCDVGMLDVFWVVNFDFVFISFEFDIYDIDWFIWIYQCQLLLVKFIFDYNGMYGMMVNIIVSVGCIVLGLYVVQLVLFNNVCICFFCNIY